MIGNEPKKGDVVIDEATVCSAVIEEEWVPIVEQASGLKFNEDFFHWLFPRTNQSWGRTTDP